MDIRLIRAKLYRELDILQTEWQLFEKNIDLLQKNVNMITDEQKERIQEQVDRAYQIAEDAGEIEQAILGIVNTGGSKEAIEKAERLRDKLNERK